MYAFFSFVFRFLVWALLTTVFAASLTDVFYPIGKESVRDKSWRMFVISFIVIGLFQLWFVYCFMPQI